MTEIKHKAFLFDATRCIDCRACMVACSVENTIAMDKTRIWVSGIGVKGVFPDLQRASMVYHCMHCNEPDCLSACPVGAAIYNPAFDVTPAELVAAIITEKGVARAPLVEALGMFR